MRIIIIWEDGIEHSMNTCKSGEVSCHGVGVMRDD